MTITIGSSDLTGNLFSAFKTEQESREEFVKSEVNMNKNMHFGASWSESCEFLGVKVLTNP